jgi:hypothetical protein
VTLIVMMIGCPSEKYIRTLVGVLDPIATIAIDIGDGARSRADRSSPNDRKPSMRTTRGPRECAICQSHDAKIDRFFREVATHEHDDLTGKQSSNSER